MQLAVISPTAFLSQFASRGDIHLVLAHLVLQDPAYRDFYRRESKYKILDNGAFELRRSLTPGELLEAASMVKADEIVAPDVIGAKEATMHVVESFTYAIKSKNLPYKIMAVPQGEDAFEWIECFVRFCKDKWVDVVGIGYKSCLPLKTLTSCLNRLGVESDTRLIVVQAASQTSARKTIHLLGGGSCANEIIYQSNFSTVRSMDTSLPYVYGKEKILLDVTGNEIILRPEGKSINFQDDTLGEDQKSIIIQNIDIMKGFATSARGK